MYGSVFCVILQTILSAIILYKECHSQVTQFGSCADVATVEFFDLERFLGEWHVIERYPSYYEREGQCASKHLSLCGNRLIIRHMYVLEDVQFVVHMNSTYLPGSEAIFDIDESSVDPLGTPLSVVATDYENYALMFGCKSNDELKIRHISAWILSRSRSLNPDLLDQAHTKIKSLPMARTTYLEVINQDDRSCRHDWTAHMYED